MYFGRGGGISGVPSRHGIYTCIYSQQGESSELVVYLYDIYSMRDYERWGEDGERSCECWTGGKSPIPIYIVIKERSQLGVYDIYIYMRVVCKSASNIDRLLFIYIYFFAYYLWHVDFNLFKQVEYLTTMALGI